MAMTTAWSSTFNHRPAADHQCASPAPPGCSIEAIKAKQASRAAAANGILPPEAAAAAPSAGRVFSKHVAIPLPAGLAHGSRGSSAQSTPYGSPSRRELLSDAAALPQLEAPSVWQGFQVGRRR